MIVQIIKRDGNDKPIEAYIKGKGFELRIVTDRRVVNFGRPSTKAKAA